MNWLLVAAYVFDALAVALNIVTWRIMRQSRREREQAEQRIRAARTQYLRVDSSRWSA